jgi:hypothetical protein
MVFPVTLTTRDQVTKLNTVASEQDFDIYIHCGNMMIDAKSLLGLLTLIGREGYIVAPDHIKPDNFVQALKKMGYT